VRPTAAVARLLQQIGKFSSLETLRVFGVWLKEVPSGVRELQNLRSLNLFGAGLKEIPSWLGQLQHLSSITLRINELSQLPSSLADLTNLESLDLAQNQFTEIPLVLFRIPSLARLELQQIWPENRGPGIKEIPREIVDSPNLTEIDLSGHPVETPPIEVVKKGAEAIKNYWRQQQEAGIDYLCEAKLLVIGEPGAGKTSLAKKLKDHAYALKPAESSTEGIEITRWNFRAAIRVKQGKKEKLLDRNFRVNIWDFGGQEVYHATHQFFLTRRSLYALVVDDRKEDTDFNYWLNVVELLSDASPTVIVQNEKQDRQREINMGSLHARFPNLRETLRINLADNRGLDGLAGVLKRELQQLPHIGVPLPRTWNLVREALERDYRNYLSVEEYLAICQTHGFQRKSDKLQLSGYLHDLGICLHFQDDPVLKQTLILKPRWGTDAVYRVLDNDQVIRRRGRFGPEDLNRIWSDHEYASMHHELLRLMMRFQLCYELSSGAAYIAPQLLSSTQPEYRWDQTENLVLRYEYDFMPKGLVTRLIVALNHLIAEQELVWKSGVILERDSTRAEIIEDYPHRKISVRIAGPDTRGMFAILDDQLDRIHKSFNRLKYEKYLPCNCEECLKGVDPFAYPLGQLRNCATAGRQIQCWKSYRLVDPAALIRDLLPAPRLADRRDLRVAERVTRSEPSPRKEVFVSYAWTPESKAIVDQIENALASSDIALIRDRNELRYKDSIRTFMERIGRGKCIVTLLSKRYLQSKSCMFELTEMAEREGIRDRIFPIVLGDANVYDASGRLDYIGFWEEMTQSLDAKMKTVRGDNLIGIREELDLFSKIRSTIAAIVNILADMNTLTAEQHQGSNFEELIQGLKARLAE